EPAELFYGGTSGALAAAASAARRQRARYALDLEDFHDGEFDAVEGGERTARLVARIERALVPGAAFVTAASDAIAAAYEELHGRRPLAVHNTFPLEPAPEPSTPPAPPGSL